MNNSRKKKLLQNRKVVEEIKRHLWIESEKAGYDLGFDQAATDWLERFSEAWMKYHMPNQSETLQEPPSKHSKQTPSNGKARKH